MAENQRRAYQKQHARNRKPTGPDYDCEPTYYITSVPLTPHSELPSVQRKLFCQKDTTSIYRRVLHDTRLSDRQTHGSALQFEEWRAIHIQQNSSSPSYSSWRSGGQRAQSRKICRIHRRNNGRHPSLTAPASRWWGTSWEIKQALCGTLDRRKLPYVRTWSVEQNHLTQWKRSRVRNQSCFHLNVQRISHDDPRSRK